MHARTAQGGRRRPPTDSDNPVCDRRVVGIRQACRWGVTEAGRTPLWAPIESAYQSWNAIGRPSWDRLGLTVTSAGEHLVWLDEPGGEHRWTLPTVK